MPSTHIPMKVLADQLADAIDGRRVRTAVFTTFSFDPGFFELHILPLLFDQPFSQPDKVRRLQLEDALRTMDHLAVYFDRRGLAQDAEPAQLDYRRLDVSRQTGYFHPKMILLLVDDGQAHDGSAAGDRTPNGQAGRPLQSLVIGVLSANLTRAGWWENVECAHFDTLADIDIDGARCPYRPDLLSLVRRLRQAAAPSDDQRALVGIHEFLLHRTSRERVTRNRAARRYHTRLFGGQSGQTLSRWLERRSLEQERYNLEVISPFFDAAGAGPLPDLIDVLRPREVRVHLPTESDGAAAVDEATHHAVAACPRTRWARLPGAVVSRGGGDGPERQAPRRVHAKVYRIWRRDGPDLLIVGSPNLTWAGHSHGGTGNLEAAFLVDVTDQGHPRRWWLEPIDRDIERFVDDAPAEDDGGEAVPLDLSLQFDWATGELHYRLATGVDRFAISTTAGEPLATIERPVCGPWTACPATAARRVRDLLLSTSFLRIGVGDRWWRVLVREERMNHRPSLLQQLSPEEILEYWSLLTPAQRAAFIELRVIDQLEGLPVSRTERLRSRTTLFDRFAGIYHAFGCLQRTVDDALADGRHRDAACRLFGAKYDSLPPLLTGILARTDDDPILRYVMFLCARQLCDAVRRRHPEFYRARTGETRALDRVLDHLPALRRAVPADTGADADFLSWFEAAFVRPVASPAEPS